MAEKKLKDSDRFNLMLALTALLFSGKEYKVEELAKHFNVSKTEIILAVKLVSYTELIDIYDRPPYRVDYSELEEDGIVYMTFDTEDSLTDVPRLSSRQASAIAAGLVYLSSIPGIAEIGEIEELQKIIASGIVRGDTGIEIDIVPGSIDADIAILREAITRGLCISADYLSLKGETTIARVIEPKRLEPAGEFIYLRAWCPVSNDTRAFRVDRMRDAKILEDRPISQDALSAQIPDDIYQPAETDTEVTLQVEPEAYSLIYDYKPSEEPIDIDKYTKQFKIMVGDVRNLGRIIARFGGAAKVIAPAEARTAVRDFALSAIEGNKTKTPKDAE